jgi:hypothetical protein
MRRSLTLGVLIAILGIAPACNNTSSPSAPLPLPPAPPAPKPTAVLAVEHTSLIVRPCPESCGTTKFLYEPRFQLRETSGKSGATIQNLFVADPVLGGGDNTGPGCWRIALRVPPGGTLDTFYSDEGWNWLGYCGVWGGGTSATGAVSVVVTFTDDDGVSGTAGASLSGASRTALRHGQSRP